MRKLKYGIFEEMLEIAIKCPTIEDAKELSDILKDNVDILEECDSEYLIDCYEDNGDLTCYGIKRRYKYIDWNYGEVDDFLNDGITPISINDFIENYTTEIIEISTKDKINNMIKDLKVLDEIIQNEDVSLLDKNQLREFSDLCKGISIDCQERRHDIMDSEKY